MINIKNSKLITNKIQVNDSPLFITSLFTSIIVMVISAILIIPGYYGLQNKMFLKQGSILIVYNSITTIFLLASPAIISFLLMFKLFKKDKKISGIGLYTIGLMISILFSVFVLFFQFFNYSIISNDGIYERSSLFSNEKLTKWENINQVYITYHYGNKGKIQFDYLITLSKDQTINLCNSMEYFNKVIEIDKIVRDKNIPTVRDEITPHVFEELKYEYSGPGRFVSDRFEIILKVFNYN